MSDEHKTAKAAATNALATVNQEIDELAEWTIDDDDDRDFAGAMLANVKGRFKALEKKRKEITGPINKGLKAVNDLFREPKARLEECERILKGKLADYVEQLEQANDEAYDTAGAAETVEEATAALASVKVAETPKGVSIRYTWKATVVDATKVPIHLMSPDMKKIEEEMRGKFFTDTGAPCPIAGVQFTKTPIVSSRSA